MMTHTLLLYCLVFLLPTESCRALCQAASKNKEKVSARPHGVCDGVCVDNSRCTQPCPPDTQGNMGFSCRQKKWHMITDTCRTLTAFNIFEADLYSVRPFGGLVEVDQYARKSETITEMLMQKCPRDFSCVIRKIQQSPRIPGNIAVIVQILHNISTALLTDVDEAKMRGFFILVFGTILDPKIREALKVRVTSAKRISRISENLSSDFSGHPTKGPS